MSDDRIEPGWVDYADIDGVLTRFVDSGDTTRPPLVLLHGGDFGDVSSFDTWSLNLGVLARHFRVLALDKLGQGFTGPPVSHADFTYDAVVRHTERWLDRLGVKRAHLLGHSRGGMLAASLACNGRAESLIIANCATLGPVPADPSLRVDAFHARLEASMPPGPPTPDSVSIEPHANSCSLAHISAAFVECQLDLANCPSHIAVTIAMDAGLRTSTFQPNLTKRIAELRRRIDLQGLPVRSLLIWSRCDPSARWNEVGLPLWEQIARTSPETELHLFNEAGHYSHRECPMAYSRVVSAFAAVT